MRKIEVAKIMHHKIMHHDTGESLGIVFAVGHMIVGV
jgi:hypothetical protein